ncbi:MAG: xanthine dehydrogenase family protein molybdopterin-binding subunit [Leptolinea sp.]|jgi:CO/xanthine dehydrogenase Mo-binding subunit|nr:xanthine dehydrogenase family protein molybdopterin-binding subunit [Leptolinea sp.]
MRREVKIEKKYCFIDAGKAIIPQQLFGRIEGGLMQSMGYAVMENFVEKEGQVSSRNRSTYLVPTILDIPEEMNIMVLEISDPRGPWGARGLGEVMNMYLAPAVTAAVFDATGIWFNHFPLVPEEVLKGIQKIHVSGQTTNK